MGDVKRERENYGRYDLPALFFPRFWTVSTVLSCPFYGVTPVPRGGAPAAFPGISISITRRRGCWRRWPGRGRMRALARELREVIAARHDLVLARWHEAGGCPLDLHRLVPIPGAILQGSRHGSAFYAR